MFGVHFVKTVPISYRAWKTSNYALYSRFAWNLISQGIMVEPDSREPWFICESHQSVDLDWFEKVVETSLSDAIEQSCGP